MVAEGVEGGGAVAGALRSVGCQEGRGYHWVKPVPPEALANLLGGDRNTVIKIAS